MKFGKYIKLMTCMMAIAMGFSFVSRQSSAQELKSSALNNYLAQMEPSEEDKEKCKETTCAAIVAEVFKLSPNLQDAFVVNPFSEAVIQALPTEIAASLQNNREALRTFDVNAPTANNANDAFTIGEDGRPVFGGTNPQKIVWGQLLGQSSSSLPQRNISFIGDTGEEPGQSGTGVNSPGNNPPSNPDTPNQTQAQQADARLIRALDDQLNNQANNGLEGNRTIDAEKQRFENEFQAYQAAIQNELGRKSQPENPSALNDFLRLYNPLNWFKDQDPNNLLPIVTEADKAEIRKELQDRLGGRRPGATDPAYLSDQAEPTYNRPLTKEEQEELNRYTGTGGYYRTRDAQAGAGIDVAPVVTGFAPRPAPVSGCDQPGALADCNQ